MSTIMIADDSAFMRIVLKDIIVQAGHQVVAEAENGLIAVDRYHKLRPDLVMMNIVMPELYGLEALKRIKKLDPYAKVIICSAMGNPYNVVEAIQSGASDFIVKPFDSDRIKESINRVLQK